MSTPASFVWVQLYYNEMEEPEGRVFKIKPVPDDVDALAKEVKVERPNALNHCDAADLSAFSPGTKPPFAQGNSLKPGKKLEELIEELKDKTPPTSDDHPLVVVAPSPRQQLAPTAKKRKLAYQFGKKFGRFAKYVDGSINNIEDIVIYERDDVEQEILSWLEPIKASPKPNCVTIGLEEENIILYSVESTNRNVYALDKVAEFLLGHSTLLVTVPHQKHGFNICTGDIGHSHLKEPNIQVIQFNTPSKTTTISIQTCKYGTQRFIRLRLTSSYTSKL